jgi:hypothetical protein
LETVLISCQTCINSHGFSPRFGKNDTLKRHRDTMKKFCCFFPEKFRYFFLEKSRCFSLTLHNRPPLFISLSIYLSFNQHFSRKHQPKASENPSKFIATFRRYQFIFQVPLFSKSPRTIPKDFLEDTSRCFTMIQLTLLITK